MTLHDTAGYEGEISEVRQCYMQVADAFMLVYDVNSPQSFQVMTQLKRLIERYANKEKKETPIVILCNHVQSQQQLTNQADMANVQNWCAKENVKIFDVDASDRKTLIEPTVVLSKTFFHAPKETTGFSIRRKLKPDKPNSASILMDI